MRQLQFSAQRNASTTHRFHDACVPKVVQHAQFGNFFHHVQVNMERDNAGSWSKMIDSYLQQVIVGKVSEAPRVMGVKAAREARSHVVDDYEQLARVCAAKDGDDKKTMQRESRAKKLIGCLGVCKTATFAMQRIQYASLTHGALQLHAVAAVTLAHIN